MAPVNVGVFVRLEAAEGREDDLAEILRRAHALVEEEPATTVWYAVRFGPASFGIFDAFEDDAGRQTHLNGAVVQGLQDNADLFAQDPAIEEVEVLASK